MRLKKELRHFYQDEIRQIPVPPMPAQFADTTPEPVSIRTESGGIFAALAAGALCLALFIAVKPNLNYDDSAEYLFTDSDFHQDVMVGLGYLADAIENLGGNE